MQGGMPAKLKSRSQMFSTAPSDLQMWFFDSVKSSTTSFETPLHYRISRRLMWMFQVSFIFQYLRWVIPQDQHILVLDSSFRDTAPTQCRTLILCVIRKSFCRMLLRSCVGWFMTGRLLADNAARSDRSILFAVGSVIIANRKSRLGMGVVIGHTFFERRRTEDSICSYCGHWREIWPRRSVIQML